MNLNQVTLPALDIEKSSSFYRGMGFTQIVAAPHYARFECPDGDATFSIHKMEVIHGNTGVVVYFECADLDERVNQLQAGGYAFSSLPTDEPWLWREARLEDPAGNILCLFLAGDNRKNPPWKLKTSGV